MVEAILDILAPRGQQLAILVPYLEEAAKNDKLEPLPLTVGSAVLFSRYLSGGRQYVSKGTLKTEGAFFYYLKLIAGKDE